MLNQSNGFCVQKNSDFSEIIEVDEKVTLDDML